MKVGDILEVKKEFEVFTDGRYGKIFENTKHKIVAVDGNFVKFKEFNMTIEGVKKHFKNDY